MPDDDPSWVDSVISRIGSLVVNTGSWSMSDHPSTSPVTANSPLQETESGFRDIPQSRQSSRVSRPSSPHDTKRQQSSHSEHKKHALKGHSHKRSDLPVQLTTENSSEASPPSPSSNDSANHQASGPHHRHRSKFSQKMRNLIDPSRKDRRARSSSRSTVDSSYRYNNDSFSLSDRSTDYIPKRFQVKTKARRKDVRDFDNLFLAQELHLDISHPSSQDDNEAVLGLPTSAVWSMKFSPDGRYLVAAGVSCVVYVWEVKTMHPNSRKAAGADAKDAQHTQAPENPFALYYPNPRKLTGHSKDITCIAFGPNNFFLTGSMDGTARLWHAAKSSCLGIFTHGDACTCVAFNPSDSRKFVTGSLDQHVRIWSIAERRVTQRLRIPEIVTSCSFTSSDEHVDNYALFVGTAVGKVYCIGMQDFRLLTGFQLQNPVKIPTGAEVFSTVREFAKQRNLIDESRVVKSSDFTLCEPQTTQFPKDPGLSSDEEDLIRRFSYDPDNTILNERVAIFGIYGRIAPDLFEKDTSKPRKIVSILGHDTDVGRCIFVSTNYSQITQFSTAPLVVTAIYKSHANSRSTIECDLSSHGSYVMSASEDKRVFIWNTRSPAVDTTTSRTENVPDHAPRSASASKMQEKNQSEEPPYEVFDLPATPTCAIFSPVTIRQWFTPSDDPFLGSNVIPSDDSRDAIIAVADVSSGIIKIYRNSPL